MDPYGSIHRIDDEEHKLLLETLNGPLVKIEDAELEKVAAMNREMRRQWHRENKDRPRDGV